jgi:hypothetical protein
MKNINFTINVDGTVHYSGMTNIVEGENDVTQISATFPPDYSSYVKYMIFKTRDTVSTITGNFNVITVEITDGIGYVLHNSLVDAVIEQISFTAKLIDTIFASNVIDFPVILPSLQNDGTVTAVKEQQAVGQAQIFANQAGISATGAKNSATAAAGSATTATTAATSADNSASIATTKATSATQSADYAAGSVITATAQATAAAGSATAAAGSATAAAGSANTANTQAGNAANSATAAAASASSIPSIASLIDYFYPVGTIYHATVSTSPATLFGRGTWVPISAGRALIGMGNNGTTNYSTVKATGGEEKHTMTTAEMVTHNHTGSNANESSHIHTTSVGNQSASHTHTPGNGYSFVNNHGYVNGGAGSTGMMFDNSLCNNYTSNETANHNHSVTVNAGSAHTHTLSINNNGSTTPFNVMQPYETCYMWERTA